MKLQRFDLLQITGCSDPSLWYAGLIGRCVPHLSFVVAHVCVHNRLERAARARLIAAAPSMLAELRSLRTLFKDQLDSFVESVTDPVTSLIPDTDDRLSAEADQDRLNQIDAVIKLATGDDAPA